MFEERLTADGDTVFHREAAKVSLARAGKDTATFGIDWHLAALPFLERREDALSLMKQWLAQMMILRPIPSLISGDSDSENLEPAVDMANLGNWFSGLVADSPFTYTTIDAYLKQVMPDLKGIRNPERVPGSRSLILQFGSGNATILVPFKHLSDGEKCLFAGALVLAAAEAKASPFCFWDEPDSHLALSEVGHFTMALRKGFHSNGQFVATSHNAESIQRYSSGTTLLLYRKGHTEPSQVRPVAEIDVKGDLITALTLDDLPV